MVKKYFKFFSFFVCAAITSLCFLIPLETNACGHCRYYVSGGTWCNFNFTNAGNGNIKECNGSRVGYNTVWKLVNTCDCCPDPDGGCDCCRCIDISSKVQTCNPWQVADTNTTAKHYGYCRCERECLNSPQNPKYYDNPKNRTLQAKNERIHLPAVLAWDDILGWKNAGTDKHVGSGVPANIDYGPKSYRVEIKYEEYPDTKDANLHIDKNKNPQDIETLSNGQKIFYKIIAKSGVEGFNSRDDGGACFFQTNSTYEWRVRPCCDSDGRFCKDYKDIEGWWDFSTSPGAELLGVIDELKYAKDTASDKVAHQDPDWNGPAALTDIDFCSAKLLWCKAKLVDVKPGGSYNRFDKVYNDSQQIYAFNYQMRVKSSENTSLAALIEKVSILGVIFSEIKAKWNDWKSKWNNSASDCNKWMYSGLDKAAESEAPTEEESESCHYLQRNADGSCAKPATLSFTSYFSEITNDPKFNPFFDSKNNTHQDQKFFTSSNEANLKYSWQIKPCFNSSPNQKDDDFSHCNSNRDIDFGQKWQLIGRKMDTKTLAPPMLTAPQNNQNWNDENNLIGANSALNWTALCGANSFLYDIQDQSGNSIFKTGDCQNDYASDLGRRINKTQVAVEITDKDPSQGKNPEIVQLKVNTKYKWRVQSCWPSIPVGEIKNICSKQWSEWGQFRTTGRKPNIGSDAVKMTAPTATLSWESVSGAGSYRLKISGDGVPAEAKTSEGILIVGANQFSFNYPGPRINYSWSVKTCADSAGIICGDWKLGTNFNSEDFAAPTNLSPAGEISQLPPKLTWNGNAPYYLVTAKVINGEKSTTCDPDWFNGEYNNANNKKIASSPEMSIRTAEKGASPYCSGDYEFTVQPCFDSNCASLSYQKPTAKFSIAVKEGSSGLMVCGQANNNPKTKYNEKEPCEIKHLVLGIKVIIDFVIFKLAFLLLPVMVMITGAMFYLSHDKANLVPALKDGWKKIGIGYGILFFAWIIVSILMNLVGYKELWNQIL